MWRFKHRNFLVELHISAFVFLTCTIMKKILWRVDSLLGNDSERSDYTTAVTE
jgi:hypothetical protein